MSKPLAIVALIAILLTLALTGCTGDTAPTSTPTPTVASVSFEEYLSICQESRGDDETLDEDATNKELSAMFAELLAEMESVTPPAEVADWHNTFLSVVRNVIDTLDQLPADQTIDFGTLILIGVTLESDMEEAEAILPDDVHRQMASVDCALTERSYKPETVVGTLAVGEVVRVGGYDVQVKSSSRPEPDQVRVVAVIINTTEMPLAVPRLHPEYDHSGRRRIFIYAKELLAGQPMDP